jgi:acetyl/propionyl-CoA carboxylase alpha subunit
MMFERVAIVNRGEPAVRFIHAARELAIEQRSPLISTALYTEGEATAMFVREADEAVRIHSAGRNPYLDHDALERNERRATALRDEAKELEVAMAGIEAEISTWRARAVDEVAAPIPDLLM